MAKKKTAAAPKKKTRKKAPAKKTGRKKTRKKKGMLSEMVSHAGIKKSAKAAGGGFLGGFGYGIIDSLVDSSMEEGGMRELVRIGTAATLAMIAGGALDAPNIAAGVGGGYGLKLADKLTNAVLSEMENQEYADEDSLEEYPDALDENNVPMYLAEDGEFYYLEEFQLADQYHLAESFQANDMYPQYVNSSRF